tara:strand:+ start:580 stop:807 length:228 start_codon:yes stop_codon:yes gene_type:complete
MVNNNVINFKNFKADNNDKEYIVSLYETKQYKFVVRANSIEDAENIISKRYEQGEDIQDKLDVFTFETLAAENNV